MSTLPPARLSQAVVLLACLCTLKLHTVYSNPTIAQILTDNFPNLPIDEHGVQYIFEKVQEERPEWLEAMQAVAVVGAANDPITYETVQLLRARALRLPWVTGGLRWRMDRRDAIRMLEAVVARGELTRRRGGAGPGLSQWETGLTREETG